MNLVTLYESSDLGMKRSLDRYLAQLSRGGQVRTWNDEQVLPGEERDTILLEQLKNADVVLLLVSQDFLASETCYDQALTALALSKKHPAKKVVPILLRPNSIEDTPLRDFKPLPAQNVCISQYKDPEQGYWDAYQGLKKIIDPTHRYRKRPKIAVMQALLIGLSVLLLWSFFILLWPLVYPQEGIRIMPTPFWNQADSTMYYKMYKLDHAAQGNVIFSFAIQPADTLRYGQLLPFSKLINWQALYRSSLPKGAFLG